MTKYILAGGNDLKHNEYGTVVAQEIYKTVARPAKILSCFFAHPEEWQWRLRAREFEAWFRTHFGDDISYSYCLPDTFMAQIQSSDVIYLHGGDNRTLIDRLDSYDGLPQALEGKIVVGSSAGANYLSRRYWARSKQSIFEGGGIVPYNVLVHYRMDEPQGPKTDWKRVEEELTDKDGKKPLLLSEGQFWVVEQ